MIPWASKLKQQMGISATQFRLEKCYVDNIATYSNPQIWGISLSPTELWMSTIQNADWIAHTWYYNEAKNMGIAAISGGLTKNYSKNTWLQFGLQRPTYGVFQYSIMHILLACSGSCPVCVFLQSHGDHVRILFFSIHFLLQVTDPNFSAHLFIRHGSQEEDKEEEERAEWRQVTKSPSRELLIVSGKLPLFLEWGNNSLASQSGSCPNMFSSYWCLHARFFFLRCGLNTL